MPRGGWASDLYPAVDAFTDRCLRQGLSLIDPTNRVWVPAPADDFHDRFVMNEDTSEGSFVEKLFGQLEGAPDATVLLAADILYVYYLPIHEMMQSTRLGYVTQVLALGDQPRTLEPMLEQALTTGIARFGQAKTQPWRAVRFLAEFARSWSSLPDGDRNRLLGDPWVFKAYLHELPNESPLEICALQHMLFPDTFEPIVSVDIKSRIAKTFASVSGVSEEPDLDRRLGLVRNALEPVLGTEFQFWNAEIEPVWRSNSTDPAWTFAEFALEFRTVANFEKDEIDYKLELARRLATARDAVLQDDKEWLARLKEAFGGPNNITNWREHDRLLEWCDANPDAALSSLRSFWSPESDNDADPTRLLEAIPGDVIKAPGARANLVAYFYGAWDASDWINYKPTASERALALSDLEQAETGDVMGRMERFSSFIDHLRVRVVALGGPSTTRLEAQGMAWMVTSDYVPDEWTQEKKDALTSFRAGSEPPPRPRLLPRS